MTAKSWLAGAGMTLAVAAPAYNDYISGVAHAGGAGSNTLWTQQQLHDLTGCSTSAAGLRLNNLTTTQQNALSSPAAGQTIWNTTLGAPTVYDGVSAWQQVGLLGLAQTWTAAQTFSGASIIISGNISSAAWTTNGIRIKGAPGTLTDTSSSGTVATAYTDVLGGNNIAASNATTFTNYFTMYVKDPVASTNVTLTNKWAIGGDSAKIGTSNQLTISTAGLLTVAGQGVFSLNGAVSAPPVSLTGTWFSGGSATTTKPQFLIEPAGTTSTGWSTSGTGLGVNAASGFAGNLFDFQIAGSRRASISCLSP